MDYFEQIQSLEVVKQKSKTIVVDDDTDKQNKSSSKCTKSVKSKTNAKGKPHGKDKKKICILFQQFGRNPNYHTAKDSYRHKVITSSKMQAPHKRPTGNHMSMEDLYASNLKLTKRPKSTRGRLSTGVVMCQSLQILTLIPVDFLQVMGLMF
eukprot:3856525-Ditylum_brightwellii.AAC.1